MDERKRQKSSSLKRRSTLKKHQILDKYKETEVDTDLETSFYQDTNSSFDFFDTKIHDWKVKTRISSASSINTRAFLDNGTISTNNNNGNFATIDNTDNIDNERSMSYHHNHNKPSSSFLSPGLRSNTSQISYSNSKASEFSPLNKENVLLTSPTFTKRLSSAELIENVLYKYEIKEQIGKGAFASVFKATNKMTKKNIAIKQIDLNTEDDTMELMSEINLLKSLKHVNIVKYHGFIQRHNTLNIFLEYCDGGSLRELYRKIKKFNKENGRITPSLLTEPEVKFYIRQVLKGLDYLHHEGVVHRDIKAANILLTSERIVKLADFGVSTKVNVNTVNVRNCQAAGTPNWMAPEVISLEKVSTASDIWSLGATIIELYTGYPPYHNLNSMSALHAIVSDDCPTLPKGLSENGKKFLTKCFQKDPELRSTAKDLLAHPWLVDEEGENGETTPPRSSSHSSTSHSSSNNHVYYKNREFSNPSRKVSNASSNDSVKYHSKKHKSLSSISIGDLPTDNDSSTKHRIRNISQASSLSKYIEKDYELDNWDKDFADLNNLSNLNIDEGNSYITKKFQTNELPKLKIKKSSTRFSER
ncbi:serine/threonine protein kinase [Saccharomycopsis crataegensis]|uniref:non-specific serine/threonine protein kinase n=1 Tax=Saccharomycopsis crataegensis TaxID=43959 RepID=A0AAV5QG03_9ASCO|nr:serine/threonine protein kinase [Saccharomycopsis crataegensis]